MKKCTLMLVWMLMSSVSLANEPLQFDNPAQEQRFNDLTEQLRCLVCQNQSLADSDAPLAQDLRKELYQLLQQGKNDAQIKQFLVDRYGDFVLYMPPVKGNTLILWLAPGLLLAGGAVWLALAIRRRNAAFAEQESQT